MRVESDDSHLAERLASSIPRECRTPEPRPAVGRDREPLLLDVAIHRVGSSAPPRFQVRHGDTTVMVDGRGAVATYLASLVTRHRLDAEPDSVHLHAGLVGRAGNVVLVGPSGAGKSTFVGHLVRNGWRYGSDEMTTLSASDLPTGQPPHTVPVPREVVVSPHEKAISLKGPARHVLGSSVAAAVDDIDEGSNRWEVPLDAFGATPWVADDTRGQVTTLIGAGIAVVAAIEFRPGPASATDMTPAEVLSVLVTNSMDVRRRGPDGLALLARVAANAVGLTVSYESLGAAEEVVTGALDRATSATAASAFSGEADGAATARVDDVRIDVVDTPVGFPQAVLVRFAGDREPSALVYSPSSFHFAVLSSAGADYAARYLSFGESTAGNGPAPPRELLTSLSSMGFWVSGAERDR